MTRDYSATDVSIFRRCAIVVLILLSACSAKVSLKPEAANRSLQTLAVLPPEYNAKLQREKVDAIRSALETELRNQGFVVLADRLIEEFCSTPACPERKQLAERYLVNGFVSLDLKSVSRANFLAGYYNAIVGTMRISDEDSKELLSVERTESERGGLLFNSGQILQGLISQVENTEEKSFARLSEKFAETLVSKIPKQAALPKNSDAVAVALNSTSVKELQPQLYEICADATPNSLASVIINKHRSTLRETRPGRYCGAYFLDESLLDSDIKAEVRSPFGDAVRKEVKPLPKLDVCDLQGKVFLTKEASRNKIEVACTKVDRHSALVSECANSIQDCSSDKLLVFKGSSRLGPFIKIAEIRSPSWTDRSKEEDAYYQVVAVGPSGAWSLPENAATAKKK